jgi:hypothetical protein
MIETYRIRGDGVQSDHCPIELHLQLTQEPLRRSRWKMNVFWLPDAKPKLLKTWRTCPPTLSFFEKMKSTLATYRTFCKDKAAAFKQNEHDLQVQVQEAYEILQRDPLNPVTQDAYGMARARLQHLETQKIEGKKVRCRIRWQQIRSHPSRCRYPPAHPSFLLGSGAD